MRLQSIIVICFIILFLFGTYTLTRYLQRVIRPRESMKRLLLYLTGCLFVVLVVSFLMVFIISRLFPQELIE